jgi:hypothetical protein
MCSSTWNANAILDDFSEGLKDGDIFWALFKPQPECGLKTSQLLKG